MANSSNPSTVRTKSVAAATTLTESDVRKYGHIVVDTSGGAITLTLPSPARSILGYELYISNDDDGAYNVTVSCTNGFLQDDDSFTVIPGQTAHVQVGRDASEAFRWLFFKTSSEAIFDVVASFFTGNTETGVTVTPQDGDNTIDVVVNAEWVQDLVGAMVDTNGTGTQTGITVTHQDETDDVDFVLDSEWLQDLVGAMVDSGGTATHTGITATYQDDTGDIDIAVTYGTTADTACEGDDSRLPTAWDDYTPTITWDTEPGSVTTVARYRQSGADTVEVKIYFTSADGDGRTPASITLPTITDKQVADIDALISCSATEYIDTVGAGGASPIAVWLDMEDGTPANRIIVLDGASAWTDTKDCWVSVSLSYEIEDSA
jgi:hypothetical protein